MSETPEKTAKARHVERAKRLLSNAVTEYGRLKKVLDVSKRHPILLKQRQRVRDLTDKLIAECETPAEPNRGEIATLRIDQARLKAIRDLCGNDLTVRIGQDTDGNDEWALQAGTLLFYDRSFEAVLDLAVEHLAANGGGL